MTAMPAAIPSAAPGSRRDQILDAAMQCFASAGFRGTTTREIASRVGITEAALYRHFASKESLYTSIIERKMGGPETEAGLEDVAARGDDAGVFGGLARRLIERVDADPAFIRILLFTALEGHSLAEPFFASRVLKLREFLTGYIARRIDEGAFRDVDPLLAARAFLGTVVDYVNARVVFPQPGMHGYSTDEVVETFVSLFLRGIQSAAPSAAAPAPAPSRSGDER